MMKATYTTRIYVPSSSSGNQTFGNNFSFRIASLEPKVEGRDLRKHSICKIGSISPIVAVLSCLMNLKFKIQKVSFFFLFFLI